MFEANVDALYSIFDLDGSNGLDRDEFDQFFKAFKDCIDPKSEYKKLVESV